MSPDLTLAPPPVAKPRPSGAPPALPTPRRRAVADRLRDALLALGDWHGQVLTHSERAWASITFAGTRHRFALLFAGEQAVAAGERFLEALDEYEFRIPGQLVADATVTEVEHRPLPSPRLVVQCELLLLEED